MVKKLLAAVITLSMAMSFAVMPADAASFSAANKRKNAYDICLNTDSNFTQLQGNGYDKNCLQYNSLSFNYDHTNTDAMVAGESGNFYTKNRAKFKGTSTSSKYMLWYRWAGGIMGRDGNGDTVSADIPVYVHQRLHIAWYAQKMTKFDFLPYYNDSWSNNTSAGFTFYKADGGYINTYAPKSSWSMLKYDESQFNLTTSSSSPVFNTIDVIFDLSANHAGAMYMFIEGKLVGISRPSSNRPDKFYGWAIRSNDSANRQNDYIEIWGDEATGWGHTEYIQANGYYPTLEDVLQDQGLMVDSVSDSKIMMKTSALSSYMPAASANAKVNDTQINTDVSYSGGKATISHTQSDTSALEVSAHMLQGVIPPDNSGLSYASYHPRAKYAKISFDQKINSGTVAYSVCYNTNRNTSLEFWKDNGYLYASVRGGGGNNYLNGKNGRVTAEEDATNHIDWILEFHENEENTSEGGIIQYLFCNGKFIGSGKVGNNNQNRLADITVETKGSANPEVEISNWSMTLYNDTASLTSVAGMVFDVPLDDVYDAGNATVVIPDNKVLDLGDGLNLKNGTVNTGNSYIKAGNKKISDGEVIFNSNGQIRVADGKSAKIEIDNGNGTSHQGFLFGTNNPTTDISMTFKFTGDDGNTTGFNNKEFTVKVLDMSSIEALGLVNYGISVTKIPDPLKLTIKE